MEWVSVYVFIGLFVFFLIVVILYLITMRIERMVCVQHKCPLCIDSICMWKYRDRVSIDELPENCPRKQLMALGARRRIERNDWREK
jgi:hypothetical protein